MPKNLRRADHAGLPSSAGSSVRRVLVVANQTATSPGLIAQLRERSACGPLHLHLVVPALNGRLRHWLSDTDGAVSAARRRAEDARAAFSAHGLMVDVEIGDSVPLLAIDDALAYFDADEIVISTLPPSRSHWLEHKVIERARERFGVPIRHVVASEDGTPAAQPRAEALSRPGASPIL